MTHSVFFKSRRKRWAGHVTCVKRGKCAYRVSVKTSEGKDNKENSRAD